jgi:hypothetical protein
MRKLVAITTPAGIIEIIINRVVGFPSFFSNRSGPEQACFLIKN